MKKHPEQKEGEMLLGNFREAGYHAIGWKTKRMGKIAYYSDLSKPLLASFQLYPVFVQVSEVEKVTNERT